MESKANKCDACCIAIFVYQKIHRERSPSLPLSLLGMDSNWQEVCSRISCRSARKKSDSRSAVPSGHLTFCYGKVTIPMDPAIPSQQGL